MDKNDQKEELLKRLENIKDKNEEPLKAFTAANKVIKAAKNHSGFNYSGYKFSFYDFYRGFEKFKRMSLDSKHGELIKFYKLLSNFKNHKLLKQKIVKIKFWIISVTSTWILTKTITIVKI